MMVLQYDVVEGMPNLSHYLRDSQQEPTVAAGKALDGGGQQQQQHAGGSLLDSSGRAEWKLGEEGGRDESASKVGVSGGGVEGVRDDQQGGGIGSILGRRNGGGQLMEIRIPPAAMTTGNRQVRARQLWGTDTYTDDSDIVAVLMHAGYFTPTSSLPPPSVAEVRATIQIMPPQQSYVSSSRNSMRSRAWASGKGGCSYAVTNCRVMQSSGGSVDLLCSPLRTPLIAPTLLPAAAERTMTTRAATQAAYRQHRFVQEVTIQYNLCNEPWMKYSLAVVADHGLKKSQFTSAKLKKAEVLFLETRTQRFQLSFKSPTTSEAAVRLHVTASKKEVATSATATGKHGMGQDGEELGVKRGRDEAAQGERGEKRVKVEEGRGREGAGNEGGEADGQGPVGRTALDDGKGIEARHFKGGSNGDEAEEKNVQSSLAKNGLQNNSQHNARHHGHHHQHHRNHHHHQGDDLYQWARCIKPLPLGVMVKLGCPLPQEQIEVLEDNLRWDDLEWAPSGVWVKGKAYNIARAQFMPITCPRDVKPL